MIDLQMNNKDFYRQNLLADTPIFHQPFWLDIVHGESWNVALVKKDNKIVASMPYSFQESERGLIIKLPILTQFLGPHFNISAGKRVSRYSSETEIIQELLNQIPDFYSFHQHWNFEYQNWLPFYWNNYLQTSRYTYFIDAARSNEDIWDGFKDTLRNEIRKSENILEIVEAHDCIKLYDLVVMTFQSQGAKPPYSFALLNTIFEALKEKEKCKILLATNNNEVFAGLLMIMDAKTSYYLVGGFNRNIKTGGALSKLIWEAIKISKAQGLNFDFEGSMLPGVEPYFRHFGGERKAYFSISKISEKNEANERKSRKYHLIESLRHFKKFIKP